MVPKLRFKEFCGEWEEKRLGDVADVLSGKRIPKGMSLSTVDTGIKYITVSDMGEKYINNENIKYINEDIEEKIKKYKVSENDIIISVAGTLGKINIVTKDFQNANLTENCDKITNLRGIKHKYLYMYLNSSYIQGQINSIYTVSSQPKLALTRIRDFIINTPSLPEQTKIADFLSTVDDKIQNQQDKITHLENIKKGFLQKILSRKIRFKDDGGDEFPEWKYKKLGDIAKRVMKKNNLNETNLSLTISAQYGLVDQETYFNRKVSSNDLSGYYVLNKGEFAYNKSYSTGYPFGAIKRLNKYEKGAVSTLYICFSLYENVDSNFIEQYFESDKWYREIYMIAVEGARNHGLLNMSIEDFFKTKHLLPCLKEQQKIAYFLSSFDQKISTEKETLEHLKQLKKGLLQQMFV